MDNTVPAPAILTSEDSQAYADLQILMGMPRVADLMENLRTEYPELYAHSQATAYFALLLDGDFSYAERMQLGMGALLHDIGKYPDRDFFREPRKFTTEEDQARKRAHARLGFLMARNMGYDVPAAILVGDQEWISTDRYPRSGVDRRTTAPDQDASYLEKRSGNERRMTDSFLLAAQQRCAVADITVAMLESGSSRPYRPAPMDLSAIEKELATKFLGDKNLIQKALSIAERATLVF